LLLNLLLEVGHTINTATIVQPLPNTCDLHHKRGPKNMTRLLDSLIENVMC
jgi:hypothetical protein